MLGAAPVLAVPTESGAREFVRRYCDAELAGHEERYEFAKWTTPSDDPERGVFLATWNEFAIVTGCIVANVDVNDGKGSGSIICHRIGSSPGNGIVRQESAVSEEISVALRYEHGRWWVIDPPAGRVHVDSLIEAYNSELASFSPRWEEGATEAQRRLHQSLVGALDRLRKIRSDALGQRAGSSAHSCDH
jgi:hypothetical protein